MDGCAKLLFIKFYNFSVFYTTFKVHTLKKLVSVMAIIQLKL